MKPSSTGNWTVVLVSELKRGDKLLLAMAKMHDEGITEFHEADLTVAAWRMFPETFGLGDYWKEYAR